MFKGELTIKDEECKQASSCLEDALSRTNELKEEVSCDYGIM